MTLSVWQLEEKIGRRERSVAIETSAGECVCVCVRVCVCVCVLYNSRSTIHIVH